MHSSCGALCMCWSITSSHACDDSRLVLGACTMCVLWRLEPTPDTKGDVRPVRLAPHRTALRHAQRMLPFQHNSPHPRSRRGSHDGMVVVLAPAPQQCSRCVCRLRTHCRPSTDSFQPSIKWSRSCMLRCCAPTRNLIREHGLKRCIVKATAWPRPLGVCD